MVYTHVARQGPAGVTSALDLLAEVAAEALEAAAMATRQLQSQCLPPVPGTRA